MKEKIEETREIRFYFKMEDISLEGLINLKKAFDNNKKVGGFNFQSHTVVCMQVPWSIEEIGPQFFNDMKKLKVDPYKGDWYI